MTRCPRCRAEDISGDAHPARVLADGAEVRLHVCRTCYRPAELEYRIACESAGLAYRPLAIRDALAGLRVFYRERLAEWDDPARLVDDEQRGSATAAIRAALADVERRLAIAPVGEAHLDSTR